MAGVSATFTCLNACCNAHKRRCSHVQDSAGSTDGTPQAAAALPVARTLARATQGALVLVRVASHTDGWDEPERYVRAVARELHDLDVRCVVRHGKPASEIIAAADAEHADLIVMATHGRVGLPRVVAGSVSERVLAESKVPVLLVRPGGKRVTHLETLLVPTDGTAGAALALGTAVGLARASGARLELVQAIEPVPTWVYAADYDGAPTYIDPEWEEETLRAAETYVDGIAERLRSAGGARARLGAYRCGRAHHRARGRPDRHGPHRDEHARAHGSSADADRQHRRCAGAHRQAPRAPGASARR